jgi:hypothetical protein
MLCVFVHVVQNIFESLHPTLYIYARTHTSHAGLGVCLCTSMCVFDMYTCIRAYACGHDVHDLTHGHLKEVLETDNEVQPWGGHIHYTYQHVHV